MLLTNFCQCSGSGYLVRKFLGLPDPDPLVTGTDPDSASDPPIIKQNCKTTLDFYCFVTSI
jgi:hypothetical protein